MSWRPGGQKLGTWPWIVAIVFVLLGVPLVAVAFKDFVARYLGSPLITKDAAHGSLKVSQLRISAPIARRYSFTARPH